jgi:hypothetical protein
MTNARGHATTVYDAGGDGPQSAVYVDKVFRSVPMGNLKHIVGDIHNILKAYHEVARERFVDTICWTTISSQAETPLRVLSPDFVHEPAPSQYRAQYHQPHFWMEFWVSSSTEIQNC